MLDCWAARMRGLYRDVMHKPLRSTADLEQRSDGSRARVQSRLRRCSACAELARYDSRRNSGVPHSGANQRHANGFSSRLKRGATARLSLKRCRPRMSQRIRRDLRRSHRQRLVRRERYRLPRLKLGKVLVLCLHGVPDSCRSWARCLKRRAEEGDWGPSRPRCEDLGGRRGARRLVPRRLRTAPIFHRLMRHWGAIRRMMG